MITYSFVEKRLQLLLDLEHQAKPLLNPITSELSMMRTSLWPGLVSVLLYNKNRQQTRIRLFESGLCFIPYENALLQQHHIGGLISGQLYPLQWGHLAKSVDFFDLKGDLCNLLQRTWHCNELSFSNSNNQVLHPKQSEIICQAGKEIGIFGALHPTVLEALGLTEPVFVFEIQYIMPLMKQGRIYQEISKFPELRRDMAFIVDQSIPVAVIQDTIKEIAPEWLREIVVFDVYQGKGITQGKRSLALAFFLQHLDRTLKEVEVTEWMNQVFILLEERFGAELRR